MGERVQSRNYYGPLWQYGTIIKRLGKLPYIVRLDNNRELKRYVDQLRKTKVKEVYHRHQPPEYADHRLNWYNIEGHNGYGHLLIMIIIFSIEFSLYTSICYKLLY